MRSLTQSSASLFPALHRQEPAQATPVQGTVPIRDRQPAVPAQRRPKPVTPSPNQHPFFNITDNSNVVSSRARNHISQAIQSSWANSTIRRYSGTIKQFIRFCDEEHVPEHLRFPADEFVLCAFVASSLGRHAGSTPRSRLSALKAWHLAHNMEWKGSERLRYVLNGVHNLAPDSSKLPLRPPINAHMLTQLIDSLDLEAPMDVVVAACAATAFWGQCRLGELVPASLTSLTQTPLPTRSDFKRSIRNPQSCLLHLPHTKTHRHGQDIVLVDQIHAINPISLMKKHFRVNNVPNDAYIFSFTTAGGLSHLTKAIFLHRCNTIWRQLGYPRIAGHCFRIGGTTELLVAGTPPDIVKATGRWSSDSFMRYWRSLDDIAPRHVRNVHRRNYKRRKQ